MAVSGVFVVWLSRHCLLQRRLTDCLCCCLVVYVIFVVV